MNIVDLRAKYLIGPDGRDWTVETAKMDLANNKMFFVNALYRPFDFRNTVYTGKTKGFFAFPRHDIMDHFVLGKNLGLVIPKQTREQLGGFVTKNIAGHKSFSGYDKSSVFPLYLYPETSNQTSISESQNRVPNLDMEIVNKFAEGAGLYFVPEENPEGATVGTNVFLPIDLLDYIYAVLHSQIYRKKYKEFLKIDFPRVPYPKDAKDFFDLVDLGSQLRKLHLLESEETEQYITQYPIDGNNEVGKLMFVCHPEPVEGQIKRESLHQL